MTNEEYIWQALLKAGYNEIQTAGIMGNLMHESGLRPNNLQWAYEQSLHMTDQQYTDAVNSGAYSYKQFYSDCAGYGIAQWTYYSRKQCMYQACWPTIDSIEKQTAYLIKELSWYPAVQAGLAKAKTIREASDVILVYYEAPADQSESMRQLRASYGQAIYDRQHGAAPAPKPATKTVDELAKEVINGLWGNGDDRKKRLEAAGYSYRDVQNRVNEILAPKPAKKTVDELAKEVIDGKWGNGVDRKNKLEAAGYSYRDVQNRVNEMLAPKPQELTEWYACQCAAYKTKQAAINNAKKVANTTVYKVGALYVIAIGKFATEKEAATMLPEARKQRLDAFVNKFHKSEVIS